MFGLRLPSIGTRRAGGGWQFVAHPAPLPVGAARFEKVQFITERGPARVEKLSKYFDLGTLERDAGGQNAVAFDSRVFLETQVYGRSPHGAEYDEQLSAAASAREAPSGGGPQVSAGDSEKSFRAVAGDERVLALVKEERDAVRKLAHALSSAAGAASGDCLDGLADDAGAIIRYLRACGWNATEAEERIYATARWRRDFGFAALRGGSHQGVLERLCDAGLMYVRGFDLRGRPIIYVRSPSEACQPEELLHLLVYCLERACACADRREEHHAKCCGVGQTDSGGKVALLVDLTGYDRRYRPPLDSLRKALGILQDHFPERLGEAFLLNAPRRFQTCWWVVSQLLDPTTREKAVFIDASSGRDLELLGRVVAPASLERRVGLGGELDAPFDAEVFLRQLVRGSVHGAEFEEQLWERVQEDRRGRDSARACHVLPMTRGRVTRMRAHSGVVHLRHVLCQSQRLHVPAAPQFPCRCPGPQL